MDELLEALAVFGEVDHVRRRSEDRNVRRLQRCGELQRRLPAELHDHAEEFPRDCSNAYDLQDIFGGQGLEVSRSEVS